MGAKEAPTRPSGGQVLSTGAGMKSKLTFHHAAQEPAGPSGRPGPGRRPGRRWVVFSGGRSCLRLQRSPRGGGRIGAALALPLLQRRLAFLLHHPPAADSRSSPASVRWATGPEPCKGPRLRTLASRVPSPPPPPFPLPLGGGRECPDEKGGGTGWSPLSAAASDRSGSLEPKRRARPPPASSRKEGRGAFTRPQRPSPPTTAIFLGLFPHRSH